MVDVPSTLGALLVGGAVALVCVCSRPPILRLPADAASFVSLSGIVTVQCIIFYKLYPNEVRIQNLMVRASHLCVDSGRTYLHNDPRSWPYGARTLPFSPSSVLTPFIARLLDLLHSAFIVTSLFNYFIDFFGDTCARS
jgi:hypothetical protein